MIHQSQSIARTLRLLLALGMCCSIGFHWAALQTVAWAGMLIAYTQDSTLTDAVKKTFDGEHPCSLCHAVKKGREQTPNKSLANGLKKLDAVLCGETPPLLPATKDFDFSFQPLFASLHKESPPTPPPQA